MSAIEPLHRKTKGKVVRLSESERQVLLDAAHRHFGETADVWLFGSRVRDDARGGDIDLLIETPEPIPNPLAASLAAEAEIQSALDDPRVDILVISRKETALPIHRLARSTGVRL